MSGIDPVWDHIKSITEQAYLEVMEGVLSVIRDREQLSDATLLALTPQDVDDLYVHIGDAIDRIEDELLAREEGTE